LVVANVVRPGAGLNIDPATLDAAKVADYAAKAHESSVTGFLLGIIPDTLISAFAEGNILQVLFVAVVFGVALALCGEAGAPILAFSRRCRPRCSAWWRS
jgi:aerobic C4-dicarboxylate transport protein